MRGVDAMNFSLSPRNRGSDYAALPSDGNESLLTRNEQARLLDATTGHDFRAFSTCVPDSDETFPSCPPLALAG